MHPALSVRVAAASCGAALLFVLVACDEPKPTAASTVTTSASAIVAAPASRPKTMPVLLVDAEGPYLDGKRVNLAEAGGKEKLTKILGDLPIDNKPVVLIAQGKAKTPDVTAVVAALGAAGAPTITIKTDGRTDLPKEIVVTPASRVSGPPACSVVTMVMGSDLSTAVWPYKGGLGRRQRKGLAGPDLTHTGQELKKAIAGCSSTMAFVSGDDGIGWELTYNLAATLLASDDKKKLDTLVLLPEPPVAGRAIEAASK
jgi:biopolymer transport protein ExbD